MEAGCLFSAASYLPLSNCLQRRANKRFAP